MSKAEHHVFLACGATFVAPPLDTHEADRIEWIPLDRIQDMIDRREIVAGVAVTGLLQVLARQLDGSARRSWLPATRPGLC